MSMFQKRPVLTRDGLKAAAILAMTLNHIATVCFAPGLAKELLLTIGYMAAPIMLFFLEEGYRHTRSLRKYAARLFCFALISVLPYRMAGISDSLNMMFTLFFCLLLLIVMDRYPGRNLGVFLALLLIACCLLCDWGALAPFYVLLFRAGRNRKEAQPRAFALCALLFFGLTVIEEAGKLAVPLLLLKAAGNTLGILLSAYFVLYLRKETPYKPSPFRKYFFYAYYPLHILALWGLRQFI